MAFDPTIIPSGVTLSQADWNTLYAAVQVQVQYQFANLCDTLRHMSGPTVRAIAGQVQLSPMYIVAADDLCKSGLSYPIATELARQINTGVGNIGALHRAGFSASDSTAVVAGITARGAH